MEGIGRSSTREIDPSSPSLGKAGSLPQRPIDQSTQAVGQHSLQRLKEGLIDVERNHVSFHAGKSPLEAKCRETSSATQKCVVSLKSFEYLATVFGQGSPVSATPVREQQASHTKQSLAEGLIQSFPSIIDRLEKGEIGAREGNAILHFAKQQETALGNWSERINSFIDTNKDNPSAQNLIGQSKTTLGEIKQQRDAIGEGAAKLEKTIVSKFGNDALDHPAPAVHAGASQVHIFARSER